MENITQLIVFKRPFLCFIGLFLPLIGYNQLPTGFSSNGVTGPISPDLQEIVLKIQKGTNNYRGYEGSPFLLDKWTRGLITTVGGRQFSNLALKFNLQTRQLLYRANESSNDAFEMNLDIIQNFSLSDAKNDSTIHFQKFDFNGQNRFYQVLYAGKHTVVADLNKQLIKNDTKSFGNSGGNLKDEFITRKSLYFIQSDSLSFKIKKKKKALLELFGSKKKEVAAYISQNDLNFSKDQDIVRLFTYYDGL